MKALAIDQRPSVGELNNSIRLVDLPRPTPKRGQVRVKVLASTINIDDPHMAEGTMFGGFPVTPTPTRDRPWVPGTDLVGIVDALGPGVKGPAIGTLVYGMRPPRLAGPWAEWCITKADYVSPAPTGWRVEELACLGLGGTVVSNMLDSACSDPLHDLSGRRCLVVGASGSLGTLMVPLLADLGAEVWGVCSGLNRALVENLGAARVLDYHDGSFGEQLQREGANVDHCFDFVGGRKTQDEGLAVTKDTGHFVTAVGPEQHVGERKLAPRELASMVAEISWRWLRSCTNGPRYHFSGPLGPDFQAIERLIVGRGIRPIVDKMVDFDESAVRQAIGYVTSHRARGKVVLKLSDYDEQQSLDAQLAAGLPSRANLRAVAAPEADVHVAVGPTAAA